MIHHIKILVHLYLSFLETYLGYVSKISMLQKIFASNFGGLYFLVFDKKMIPLNPIKLKFTEKYMISSFPKSSLNRVK